MMCYLQQRLFEIAERTLRAERVNIYGVPAINDGDKTDRYVTKDGKTYKLQFKFTNNEGAVSPNCFTSTSTSRTSPYEEGVNDYYIFSVGTVTSTMLILPEAVLIKEGVVKTSTQPGKTCLTSHLPETAFQYHKKHVKTVTDFLRSVLRTNHTRHYHTTPKISEINQSLLQFSCGFGKSVWG